MEDQRRPARGPRIRRLAGAGTLGFVGLLGVQAQIARRRKYLSDPPPGVIGRYYGSDGRVLRLVVIGDSTAVGVGAGALDKSYPACLGRALAGRGYSVELHIVGRSGVRWRDVAGVLVDQAVALQPDLVLIGVGGNDAIHLTRLSQLRAQVRAALRILKGVGVPVVVLLGPRFDTPALSRPLRDAVEARGRAVNRAIRWGTTAEGVTAINPRPHIGLAFTRDPHRYFSEDLFHPGPEGYRLWAEAMLEKVFRAAQTVCT